MPKTPVKTKVDIDEEEDELSEREIKSNLRMIDAFEKHFPIRDYTDPILKENLPKHTSSLLRYVAGYRDRNFESLATIYLLSYPVWHDNGKDVSILFESTGVDRDKLKYLVENMEVPKSYSIRKYYITEVPIIILLIIRYFILNNKTKEANVMSYYLAYSLYWMAFTRSFKYPPQRNVMVYTINELRPKFKLKQMGTVDKWLFSMMNQVIITYKDLLLSGSDYELYYIVDAARTKIGNSINSISNHYYENHRNGKIVFEGDTFDAEGVARESNSESDIVASMSTKYTNSFFAQPLSEKSIRYATHNVDIGMNEVRNTLSNLKDNTKYFESVQTFYEAVFSMFFQTKTHTPRDVTSTTFLSYMSSLYKKGNTADPHMITIRECLNKWLEATSPLYRASARAATQSNYRKVIYTYMIYIVASSH